MELTRIYAPWFFEETTCQLGEFEPPQKTALNLVSIVGFLKTPIGIDYFYANQLELIFDHQLYMNKSFNSSLVHFIVF